jgi:hypothetical protein
VVVVLVALVLSACQLQVRTTIAIDADGRGRVTQAVGLDDAALARIGDLSQQMALEDLHAAGWQVDDPVREDDTTWVRATKEVHDTTALAVAVSELTGTDGMFRDVATGQSDAFLDRTTELSATIDLSQGASTFADPELLAVAGNPFGALLAEVEAEEGRPLADMVDVAVTVELPGGVSQTWEPRLDDPQPTQVELRSHESKVGARLTQLVVVLLVVLTGLVLWRAWVVRRRRTRRMMAARLLRR